MVTLIFNWQSGASLYYGHVTSAFILGLALLDYSLPAYPIVNPGLASQVIIKVESGISKNQSFAGTSDDMVSCYCC